MEKSLFQSILSNCKPDQYAEFEYTHSTGTSHMPTVVEGIAHLKFLKALGEHKKYVLDGIPQDELIKTWQVYVTNAVRRFIIFVSAYRARRLDDELTEQEYATKVIELEFRHRYNYLEDLIPPLDILMVWHSFLLNPKSFYDTCARNRILDFAYFPFPLLRISEAIDNETFSFNPSNDQLDNFRLLIKSYEVELEVEPSIDSIMQAQVDIHCAVCRATLSTIPYTNGSLSGFADEGFSCESVECECEFLGKLNHDQLRRREVYADLINDAQLPNISTLFSNVITRTMYEDGTTVKTDERVKSIIGEQCSHLKEDLVSIISQYHQLRNFEAKSIYKAYILSNLIHRTVPKRDVVLIVEDLVGCVFRQERFVEKMNEIDWLHSSLVFESMSESCNRYQKFFRLLVRLKKYQMLVPTLDIDLFWHTHQLSVYYYFKGCKQSVAMCVIDHDDKIDETRLSKSFYRSQRLYKEIYKEEYSMCFCWYCVKVRSMSKSSFKRLFRKLKPESKEKERFQKLPLCTENEGQSSLTHISAHNSIFWPGVVAKENKEDLNKKFQVGPSKNFPWRDSQMVFFAASGVFVFPPYAPYSEQCSDIWGAGSCCTVSDGGAHAVCASGGCGGGGGPNGSTYEGSLIGGGGGNGGDCIGGGGCGSSSGGGGGCGSSSGGGGGCGSSSGGGGGCGGGD
ncbi:hypothetical protein CAAN1_07S07206 [[Candida] anglica]|uniref:Uncharacterized protein n=1 Tax=[Candida] anglica TaxID=148631 RepID=A0ABP0EF78_9ASCO